MSDEEVSPPAWREVKGVVRRTWLLRRLISTENPEGQLLSRSSNR